MPVPTHLNHMNTKTKTLKEVKNWVDTSINTAYKNQLNAAEHVKLSANYALPHLITLRNLLVFMSPTLFDMLVQSDLNTYEGTKEQINALKELATAYKKCVAVGLELK